MAAAREAFLTGETDAHVKEIARRAGVAGGTLYRHFETREALVEDSPIFDDARTQMAQALDQLLKAGTAAGTIRGGVSGHTLLRALGGICGMHATEGWQDEAVRITAILFGDLRFGAQNAG
ncbi:helix-turn-helix domain-containing protein [Streptomyces sp. FXJ1.4098]|nr:helix-turn-helix domain-containing protein [Streptomyces sp. FXJ1.4098]